MGRVEVVPQRVRLAQQAPAGVELRGPPPRRAACARTCSAASAGSGGTGTSRLRVACSSSSQTARSYSRRPMPAISSTVSGTQATSRRNHSYGSRPTGTAGGRSGQRGRRAPRRTAPGRRPLPPRPSASSAAAAGSIAGQRLGAGRDARRRCRRARPRPARRTPARGRPARPARAPACAGTARSSRDHLGDPGRVDAGPQQGVEDRPERLVGPEPGDGRAPGGRRSPRSPGPSPTAAGGGRRGRAPRSGRMRASSAWNAPSSSRRRPASAASTSGSQPGGPVQARDVVPGPRLLAGTPGPEPLAEVVELAHAPSLSREGTFAQPAGRSCHTLVSQLQQNMLDLRRGSVGTFAYLPTRGHEPAPARTIRGRAYATASVAGIGLRDGRWPAGLTACGGSSGGSSGGGAVVLLGGLVLPGGRDRLRAQDARPGADVRAHRADDRPRAVRHAADVQGLRRHHAGARPGRPRTPRRRTPRPTPSPCARASSSPTATRSRPPTWCSR